MANFELVMPKLGESIIEATITRWLKQPGDMIEEDDPIVEIATDKVDSEIPSPVEGKLLELKYKEGDVVEVGKIIAVIDTSAAGGAEMAGDGEAAGGAETAGGGETASATKAAAPESKKDPEPAQASGTKQAPFGETQEIPSKEEVTTDKKAESPAKEDVTADNTQTPARDSKPSPQAEKASVADASAPKEEEDETGESDRFYSPLVKNIAKTEGIRLKELEKVKGTGKEGRITKTDLLAYLEEKKKQPQKEETSTASGPAPVKEAATASKEAGTAAPKEAGTAVAQEAPRPSAPAPKSAPQVTAWEGDEIVEMDRMRRLIADHMVMSKDVSPHVTSYIEVDVTNMVMWREKVKEEFHKREKEKITFTPIFVEATAQAIKELPGVNASVDGYKIILRKNINIGIAAALPSGNLIVPVIKNADQKNLLGLAKDVNSLADKARNNKLNPDDIQGGTFTITNLGTFGSITGSPIINQPQVAILGLGVIKKKPVVLETESGDVIAIRHMVILSLSYDHRVVDGALGGKFLQKMQQILESFDVKRAI